MNTSPQFRPGVLVVCYKGKDVGRYYADMIIEDRILLELKSQARTKNDEAQMLNYLKASGCELGC